MARWGLRTRAECLPDHFEKRDTGKRPNVLARNASWPNNPRSSARRAAQDLVLHKMVLYASRGKAFVDHYIFGLL